MEDLEKVLFHDDPKQLAEERRQARLDVRQELEMMEGPLDRSGSSLLSSGAEEEVRKKFEERMAKEDLKDETFLPVNIRRSRLFGRVSRMLFVFDLVNGTKGSIIIETAISLISLYQLVTFFLYGWPVTFTLNEYIPMNRDRFQAVMEKSIIVAIALNCLVTLQVVTSVSKLVMGIRTWA
jgi:hypothetical protein